jgi:hypothetical protein
VDGGIGAQQNGQLDGAGGMKPPLSPVPELEARGRVVNGNGDGLGAGTLLQFVEFGTEGVGRLQPGWSR